jgi:hypothetical protein
VVEKVLDVDTLRAFVDRQGRIVSFDYDGNNGACFRYSDRLKKP